MEEQLKRFEAEITDIKQRNFRVESDKAWETSSFRVFSISVLTYIIASIALYLLGARSPLLNALVPTLGFYLSTRSLPVIKRWWIRKYFE